MFSTSATSKQQQQADASLAINLPSKKQNKSKLASKQQSIHDESVAIEEEANLAKSSWQFKHKFTLNEVQQHSSLDDCWMVIFDKVYNITDFVDEHPGGDYILLEYAGRDATHPFLSSRHGSSAYKLLDKYWIGILVDEELYYSNNSSYCSVYSNLSWRHQRGAASAADAETEVETIESDSNPAEAAAAAGETPNPITGNQITSSPQATTRQQQQQQQVESDSDSGLELKVEEDEQPTSQESRAEPKSEGATRIPLNSQQKQTSVLTLLQSWSKATRAFLLGDAHSLNDEHDEAEEEEEETAASLPAATAAAAARTTEESDASSRLESCLRHIALASGWHIL